MHPVANTPIPEEYKKFEIKGFIASTNEKNKLFETGDAIMCAMGIENILDYIDKTAIVLVKAKFEEFDTHAKLLSIYDDYVILTPLSDRFDTNVDMVHIDDIDTLKIVGKVFNIVKAKDLVWKD